MPASEAEPNIRESGARRWWLLLIRLVQVALATVILLNLPLPLLDDWLPIRNIVVAIGSVVAAGKVLLDTLFYDHYWP